MYHRNKWQCTMYKTKQNKTKRQATMTLEVYLTSSVILSQTRAQEVFFSVKKWFIARSTPLQWTKNCSWLLIVYRLGFFSLSAKLIDCLPIYLHCSPLTIFASSKVHTETINYLYQQTMFLQTFSSSQYALWAKILKHACLGIVDFFQRSYA